MKRLLFLLVLTALYTSSTAKGSISFVNLPLDSLAGKEIRILFEDSQKNIWIGTRDQGIYRIQNMQLAQMVSDVEGFLTGCISIQEDPEGQIWFGGKGIMIVDEKRFKLLTKPVHSSVIFSIYRDRLGQMWLGGNRGLDYRNNLGDWIYYGKPEGLSDDVIHSIAEDKLGDIWLATRRAGLNHYDRESWKAILPETNCRKIIGTPKEGLWIGTTKGVFYINPKGKIESIREGEILIPEIIAGRGDIWFSTEGAGIFHYYRKKWKQYNASGALISNTIFSMIEAADGRLWIGTDQGLSIMDKSDLLSR